MCVVVVAGSLVAYSFLVRELFDGQAALLWCFEGAVVAYAVTFVARGVFSGLGDFRDFGLLVVSESIARLAIGGGLVLAGARSAVPFGVAIALAPIVSTAVITRLGSRLVLDQGQAVTWRDVTRAMGWLVMGSLLAQTLANAGPVVVQVMTKPGEAGQAGRFLSALVLARLSIYLFQAVQAALLPNLAELMQRGRIAEVRLAIRRVTLACAVLLLTTMIGAWLLGPFAVRLLFGRDFAISSTTMALLAGASSLFVMALALGGAAIAARGHRLNAWSWLGGVVAFTISTLAVHGLFLRVEVGYLIGSAVVAGALLTGLPRLLRRRQAGADEPVESWSAAAQ
jgi:O-antigen/teichoic acid export membrane protein